MTVLHSAEISPDEGKRREERRKVLSLNKGILLLSGPSGAGKTSLLETALKHKPFLSKTVTFTTRPPRKGERSGDSYFFISRERFLKLRSAGAFLEWAEIHKELYATAFQEICRIWESGKSVIKDVDTQGGRNIKKILPQAVTVFIYPPSLAELKKRLILRGEGGEVLKIRLQAAEKEIAEGAGYDCQIVNENLKTAWRELKKIIEKTLPAPKARRRL